MRRISIAIALTLSTFLFISVSPAQQGATGSQQTKTAASKSPATASTNGGPDTVINCASAATGRVALFTQSVPPNIILCNSGFYEGTSGTGPIGVLNPSPVASLDVAGDINTSLYYQIGESTVLTIGSAADNDTFVGVGAGANNQMGAGINNTFSGTQAGNANTSGTGNTFTGFRAGYSNTMGSYNTFTGRSAGSGNTTGGYNTFTGFEAGHNNTASYSVVVGYQAGYNDTFGANTFTGYQAGYNNIDGGVNVFSGILAGYYNTSGAQNTFIGASAGGSNSVGSANTIVGYQAGQLSGSGGGNIMLGATTGNQSTGGNNNIYIGSPGPGGSESSVIRIGGDTGYGLQTEAFIIGIYGSTSSGGIPVYINSNGRLGTATSSLRFKERVRDMGESTDALMKLRPVTYLYKPEYADGERTLQYGLIAEEVAQVYPELVAYDNEGQPYAVRYQYLSTMLLNEVQRQFRRSEVQSKVIETQQREIESLKQQLQLQNATLQERVSRLEKLVGNEFQIVAQK
jgi:hypothetical protein